MNEILELAIKLKKTGRQRGGKGKETIRRCSQGIHGFCQRSLVLYRRTKLILGFLAKATTTYRILWAVFFIVIVVFGRFLVSGLWSRTRIDSRGQVAV
jgi:hypothetical protein